MKALYGNYDPSTGSSASLGVENIKSASAAKLRVRPLFSAGIPNRNPQQMFLVTYAVPTDEPFDCHACSPLIGMAVFRRSIDGWSIAGRNNAITELGEFGKPPKASLLRVGPKRFGVKLQDAEGGSGQTTVVIEILVPWAGGITRALETVIADDNAGACGFPDALPCYVNWKTMKFVLGEDPQYFDIAFSLTGTDMTDRPPYRIKKVSSTERLRFQDGRYLQLFRRGDTTSIERFVAENATSSAEKK